MYVAARPPRRCEWQAKIAVVRTRPAPDAAGAEGQPCRSRWPRCAHRHWLRTRQRPGADVAALVGIDLGVGQAGAVVDDPVRLLVADLDRGSGPGSLQLSRPTNRHDQFPGPGSLVARTSPVVHPDSPRRSIAGGAGPVDRRGLSPRTATNRTGPGHRSRRRVTIAASVQRGWSVSGSSDPAAPPCPRHGRGPSTGTWSASCWLSGCPTARPACPRGSLHLGALAIRRRVRDAADQRLGHRPSPTAFAVLYSHPCAATSATMAAYENEALRNQPMTRSASNRSDKSTNIVRAVPVNMGTARTRA